MKETSEKPVGETYMQTLKCNRTVNTITRSTVMDDLSNIFFMERSGRSDDFSIVHESRKIILPSREEVIG